MKISFFSTHSEYKNPKKNGRRKVVFGLVTFILGLTIMAGDSESTNSSVTAIGSMLHAIVDLLNATMGKWVTVIIFVGIGILFISSGLRDIKKSN